jgi:hypothetical protein
MHGHIHGCPAGQLKRFGPGQKTEQTIRTLGLEVILVWVAKQAREHQRTRTEPFRTDGGFKFAPLTFGRRQTTDDDLGRATQTLLEPPVQFRHIHKEKDVVPATTMLSSHGRRRITAAQVPPYQLQGLPSSSIPSPRTVRIHPEERARYS